MPIYDTVKDTLEKRGYDITNWRQYHPSSSLYALAETWEHPRRPGSAIIVVRWPYEPMRAVEVFKQINPESL